MPLSRSLSFRHAASPADAAIDIDIGRRGPRLVPGDPPAAGHSGNPRTTPPAGLRRLTCLLTGLAMLGPLATDTYLPSFPAIGAQFQATPEAVQQSLSVYLFAAALMTLFHGTLSDAFGRRPVVLLSLAIFTLASIAAALAPDMAWLLACRALQGLSAGAGMVIGQAIVRDRFSGAAAHRLLASIMMLYGLAPAIAPVAGGLLQVHFGWRASFLFMAGFGLLLWLVCRRGLAETLAPAARQPLHPGAIAHGYRRMLADPQFVRYCLSIALAFGGYALYISSAASVVLHLLKLPETAFAWLFLPMIGGIAAGSAAGARLAGRMAPAVLTGWGFAIMFSGAVLNLVLSAPVLDMFAFDTPVADAFAFGSLAGASGQPALLATVAPLMCYTFGLALAMPGMTLLALDRFPSNRGMAASLQGFMLMLVFAMVAGWLAPALFHSRFALAQGMATMVALSGLSWLAARGCAKEAASTDPAAGIHGAMPSAGKSLSLKPE
jgi:DHA1 family bicyclomycin/chloramphenicol resistance-like MFS transporter